MGKGSKASQRASQKAKKFAGNVRTAKPKQEGYASFEDFWSGYQQAFIDTSKGKMEIQSLDPGEFLLFNDTPFIQMLSEKGAKEGEPVSQYLDAFSTEEMEELGTYNIKKVVCHGITSIKFVNKPPNQCNRDNEVSVDLLSQADLMLIYNAIKQLSVPEEVAQKADEFRGKAKDTESQEGTAEDSPDSQDLQSETELHIVSEDSE